MNELRYTLVSDGSSDRALLPILSWLLRHHRVMYPIQPEWADLGRLPKPPKDLSSKIKQGIDLYPCDLLFIHRDVENSSYTQRKNEIINALSNINVATTQPICVVPIRMTEAWLLINETALRRAAGNANGQKPLELPHPSLLEQHSNPKNLLYDLLRDASERKGRRLSNFPVGQSALLVAEYIDDFSPLRNLSAFRSLEADLEDIVAVNRWAEPMN
ncbi:MAG: hypothetical protein P8168_03390 [Deltaproteobacteria bacterium]|jgi:hypothetical protein